MIINSPPILPSTTPLAWWVGRLIVLLCLAMPMVPVLAQTSDPFAPLTTAGQQTQAGIMKILNYLAWFGLLGVVFMAFYGKGKFPIGWAAVIVAAILVINYGPNFLTWIGGLGGGTTSSSTAPACEPGISC